MEQQVDTIKLYADAIAMQDSAEWEKKIRKAVIENSAEYKQEQLLAAMENGNIGVSANQAEKSVKTEQQTASRYARNGAQIPFYRPSTTNLLLVIIAFLLFLNLIFK